MHALALLLSLLCAMAFVCAMLAPMPPIVAGALSLACFGWFFGMLFELKKLYRRGAFDPESEDD